MKGSLSACIWVLVSSQGEAKLGLVAERCHSHRSLVSSEPLPHPQRVDRGSPGCLCRPWAFMPLHGALPEGTSLASLQLQEEMCSYCGGGKVAGKWLTEALTCCPPMSSTGCRTWGGPRGSAAPARGHPGEDSGAPTYPRLAAAVCRQQGAEPAGDGDREGSLPGHRPPRLPAGALPPR